MHIHWPALLYLLVVSGANAQPVCQAPPFPCAVEAAINAGFAFTSAEERGDQAWDRTVEHHAMGVLAFLNQRDGIEIGRASCRERV